MKPPRPCGIHRCPKLTHDGPYCPEHTSAIRGKRERRNRAAGGTGARGTSAAWARIRRAQLARSPLCALRYTGCSVKATEVDHRDGNARDNRPSNLQSVCSSCHKRKTAKAAAKRAESNRERSASMKARIDRGY